MLTNKNEAKPMTKHISCYCKCKFNSTTCNSNQKWINKTCQCECKNYKYKKDYSWNPSTCIYENSKYLKSIAVTSLMECDEIVTVMDIASPKNQIVQQGMLRVLLQEVFTVKKQEIAIFCIQFYQGSYYY